MNYFKNKKEKDKLNFNRKKAFKNLKIGIIRIQKAKRNKE